MQVFLRDSPNVLAADLCKALQELVQVPFAQSTALREHEMAGTTCGAFETQNKGPGQITLRELELVFRHELAADAPNLLQ